MRKGKGSAAKFTLASWAGWALGYYLLEEETVG